MPPASHIPASLGAATAGLMQTLVYGLTGPPAAAQFMLMEAEEGMLIVTVFFVMVDNRTCFKTE